MGEAVEPGEQPGGDLEHAGSDHQALRPQRRGRSGRGGSGTGSKPDGPNGRQRSEAADRQPRAPPRAVDDERLAGVGRARRREAARRRPPLDAPLVPVDQANGQRRPPGAHGRDLARGARQQRGQLAPQLIERVFASGRAGADEQPPALELQFGGDAARRAARSRRRSRLRRDRRADRAADGEGDARRDCGGIVEERHHRVSVLAVRPMRPVARTPVARGSADQADSRVRPLSRRALMIDRPARVRIRARKPCLRARRRVFGWKVRFTGSRLSGRLDVGLSLSGVLDERQVPRPTTIRCSRRAATAILNAPRLAASGIVRQPSPGDHRDRRHRREARTECCRGLLRIAVSAQTSLIIDVRRRR